MRITVKLRILSNIPFYVLPQKKPIKNQFLAFFIDLITHNIDFYAPMYLLVEIERHKDSIKRIAKINDEEFKLLSERVFKEIQFIEDAVIPFEEWVKALRLVRDIDSLKIKKARSE